MIETTEKHMQGGKIFSSISTRLLVRRRTNFDAVREM